MGDADGRRAERWHALWIGVVVAAAAAFTLVVGDLPVPTLIAFLALAAAGGAGLGLARGAGRTLRLLWTVAVALALTFSGGLTGPGAAWVLTLFAAARVLRRPQADAAALAAVAVAVAWAAEFTSTTADRPQELALAMLVLAALGSTGAALLTASRFGAGPAQDAPAPAAVDPGVAGQLAAAESARAQAEAARMQAEAAREEAASANAAKSRFLANMSHELRTPLNAIMGFADIMRNRLFGPMPDRYAEYAQLIHESGEHLLDLINDVLDMSKIEAERFRLFKESFDARDAVSGVLRLMRPQAEEAGIDLRAALPDGALTVDADKRALKQIGLNLISNALKFTPRGGSVTVSLGAADGALELTVADTGVGVSPEDLERLGRPFEQAGDAESRAMGTGLGLSLVRALADLHGGEMGIESALGEGTAVTVRLPVLVEEAAPPAPTAQVIPFAGRQP